MSPETSGQPYKRYQEVKLKNFINKINSILDYTALILIVVMLVLVWMQVFMRYVLNFSPFWIESVARYCMVWAMLLSAAVLVSKDAHVRVDFIIELIPYKIALFINLILGLATLVFLVIFTYYGVEAAIEHLTVRDSTTHLSMFWPYLIVPISGVIMIFNLFSRALSNRVTNNK